MVLGVASSFISAATAAVLSIWHVLLARLVVQPQVISIEHHQKAGSFGVQAFGSWALFINIHQSHLLCCLKMFKSYIVTFTVLLSRVT